MPVSLRHFSLLCPVSNGSPYQLYRPIRASDDTRVLGQLWSLEHAAIGHTFMFCTYCRITGIPWSRRPRYFLTGQKASLQTGNEKYFPYGTFKQSAPQTWSAIYLSCTLWYVHKSGEQICSIYNCWHMVTRCKFITRQNNTRCDLKF